MNAKWINEGQEDHEVLVILRCFSDQAWTMRVPEHTTDHDLYAQNIFYATGGKSCAGTWSTQTWSLWQGKKCGCNPCGDLPSVPKALKHHQPAGGAWCCLRGTHTAPHGIVSAPGGALPVPRVSPAPLHRWHPAESPQAGWQGGTEQCCGHHVRTCLGNSYKDKNNTRI